MLINFKDNGKWGYYNSKTKKTIPAQFRDDSDFVEGFAIVKRYSNSLYGVIDEEGNDVLPFIFNLLERQDNGLFKAGSYDFNCLYNKKGEIVDANGITLDDRFQKYDVVKPFGNDLYLFKKGATKGVINKDKVIIEKNDSYHDYVEITPFLYFFRLKDSQDKIRYYNYDGLHVFSEAYEIHLLSDEYVVFYAGYDKGYGIANALGEILLPANYDQIAYIGNDLFTLGYEKEFVKYDAKNNSYIVKNGENEVVVPKAMEWCGNFENGKAIIAIGHKYGIIDSNFNTCVACDYKRVTLGYDNTAIVEAEGKCHLLDFSNGEIIVTYDEITLLSYNYFLFKKDGYYGVIDNNGSIIIQAHYDMNIELLDDGNFRVSRNSSEKNYCIIDRDSHIIILTSKGFRHLDKEIIWVNNFSEGLAIAENSQGLKGAINEQGNIVIPLQFNGNLSDFRCGYATHLLYCGNFTYQKEKIDIHGQVVPSIKEEDISNLFSDSEYISVEKMCDNRFLVQRKEDNYFAILDSENNIILPFSREKYMPVKKDRLGDDSDDNILYYKYYDYHDYEEDDDKDNFFFNKSGKRIIPDSSGYVIISESYNKTRNHFSDGLAAVSNGEGLWGFVNKMGQEQIPCVYDEVHAFIDGYCVVKEGYNLCLIDKLGKNILSGDFKNIEICKDNLFVITRACYSRSSLLNEYDERRKYNKNGEIVVPLYSDFVAIPKEYEWCDEEFYEGFLSVRKDGKWGVVNSRLELVVECIYNECFKFKEGIVIAKTDNVTVVFNNHQILFRGDYCDVKYYEEHHLFICKSYQDYFDVYDGFGILLFSSLVINSQIQNEPSTLIPIGNNFLKYLCIMYSPYENRNIEKWGLCSLNGEVVLEACFDEVGGYGSGLVSVAKTFRENGYDEQLWGFVDIKGNVVINFKYAYAGTFSHGIAQVSCKKHGSYISYNNPQSYLGKSITTSKLGLISTNGKELTDFVYEKFMEHSSGDILAYYYYQNDSPILITAKGAIYCENDNIYLYGYDWCSSIYHGLCIVMKGQRYGIVEKSGAVSFPLSEMGDVKIATNPEGYIAFSKYEVFRDVTKDGRIITCLDGNRIELPVGIHWCDEWIDGFIAVESNGKWGLLNSEFVFVLETKYESIQYIGNKRVLCCSNENDKDSYSIYSIETGLFMHLPYDICSHFENGCAIVGRKYNCGLIDAVWNKYAYGLIDNLGKELLPCNYMEIQFEKPIKEVIYSDSYEEPYDWKSDYRDAFEDEPGATWGR